MESNGYQCINIYIYRAWCEEFFYVAIAVAN